MTASPKLPLDGFDRAFIGFVALVVLVVIGILGVGAWALIELVQWVTTK